MRSQPVLNRALDKQRCGEREVWGQINTHLIIFIQSLNCTVLNKKSDSEREGEKIHGLVFVS